MPREPDGVGLPDDPAISALTAINTRGLADVLEGAGIIDGHGPAVVFKHHRGERCTFRAFSGTTPIVVKATRGSVAPAVALDAALRTAGLASGSPPTAAPLLGFDDSLNLTVTAEFGGDHGMALIGAGRGERAGALAASWLRACWATRTEIGETRGPGDVVMRTRQWAATIGGADRSLGADAARVVAILAAHQPVAAPETLVHGSLYPAHVFDLGDGPGLIDWDSFHRGSRAYDAGMFLAVIRKSRLAREREPASAARAAQSLLEGIEGNVDRDAVGWHEAAFVVKFASYLARKTKPGWTQRVAALLDESASLAAGITPRGHHH